MTTTKRLRSLDAFRGMTIAGMILVNNPGSWAHVYPPLLHSEWNGCTPTDLVFPFFLFIVGVSTAFSFAKFDYQFNRPAAIKIIKRTVLIFLVGILLHAFPFYTLNISKFRVMGVLQRIALAYGFGALLILLFSRRMLIFITALILLGYWGLMAYFGDFTLENNFARTVDLFVFGKNHVYHGFGIPFDPEGLINTIPAVGTVIIGYLIGRLLKEFKKESAQGLAIILIGIALVIMGKIWDIYFPINKALWTSSYVLYTAGLATLILMIFYWLIDIKGWKRWSEFFVVYGVNPLFAFTLSGVWAKTLYKIIKFQDADGDMTTGYSWLYKNIFVPIGGPLHGSFLFAVSHIIIFWLILLILYKRKIFIKI